MGNLFGRSVSRIIALPVILAGFGYVCFPILGNYIQEERTTDAVNHFVKTIRFSKAQSREKREPLKLCASRNGQRCSFSKDWSGGWILVNPRTSDILGRWDFPVDQLGFIGEKGTIHFNKNGFLASNPVRFSVFSRTCVADAGNARRVEVAMTGKTSVTRTACGSPLQPTTLF